MGLQRIASALVLSVVVICYLSIQSANACTCLRKHPQEEYCGAHYVVKAKVKHVRLITKEETMFMYGRNYTNKIRIRQFGVKVSKAFKAAPGFEPGKFLRLQSPEFDSMCGVQLKNDTMYVIAGTINKDGGPHQINLCNRPREWLHLSTAMRKGYGYLYKQGCGCKISRCSQDKCGLDKEYVGVCENSHNNHADQCFYEHAVCLNDGHGKCKWSTRALFSKCIQHNKNSNDPYKWEP